MKIKIISLLTVLLLICSCQSKESKLERVKLESKDNITLVKQNLYGTWSILETGIYDKDVLVHYYSTKGSITFDAENMNFCIDDKCSKVHYEIEDNSIKIADGEDFPLTNISVMLMEAEDPMLYLFYPMDGLKYKITCNLNEN